MSVFHAGEDYAAGSCRGRVNSSVHINDFDLVTLESNGDHSFVAVVKEWIWLHKY